MDTQEMHELQNSANWDTEHPEVRHPEKPGRAVVSVAFARDDFDRVAKRARERGMKTSEFIRSAALDHATHHGGRPVVVTIDDGRGGIRRDDYTSAPSRQSSTSLPGYVTA